MTLTRLLLMLATLGAGALLHVQLGMNATVRLATGHVLWAALANFTIGSLVLWALALALRLPFPAAATWAAMPAWVWVAGALGALYVVPSSALAGVLGGALLVALVVCGQTLAALAIDHHGWLGFPVRPADPQRLLGAALVLAGVVLLARR